MRLLALAIFILISTAFASVNQGLPNNHLAYYGEEFYQNFPRSVNKDSLFKILNERHLSSENDYDVIGGCKSSCYGHTSVGYKSARKIMFGELFGKRDNQGLYVIDVYCGKKFTYDSVEDVSHMGNEVNIEHTWPQSKFNHNFSKDMQKSDMHHLYPTDSMANNRRGNFKFGDVSDSEDDLDMDDCRKSRLDENGSDTIFSPPAEHRGNAARSLFYFATRYRLGIGPAEEMILRLWHKFDPIDEDEKRRHEIVAKYQKVRNPFIDYPELVEKVKDF